MRVFFDTAILRHAVRLRYGEEVRTVEWGGQKYDWKAPRLVAKPVRDVWLEGEINAIQHVADASRDGRITGVITPETRNETMSFPSPLLMRSGASLLHEIRLEEADPPFYLDRILVGAIPLGFDSLRFALDNAADERFRAIRSAVGDEKAMDAYHLRCAEHASCDHFLTTDKRLVNSIRNQRRLKLLTLPIFPSELADLLRRDI